MQPIEKCFQPWPASPYLVGVEQMFSKAFFIILIVSGIGSVGLAEDYTKDHPKEVVWKPEMGPQPQDYIRMVIDQWITQLRETEKTSHSFFGEQYITLKAPKDLWEISNLFKMATATLTDHQPEVASRWCSIPFMSCHFNVDIKNVHEARERLQFFEKTYMARTSYCDVYDRSIYDYSGEHVSDGLKQGYQGIIMEDAQALIDSLEVCKFPGPIVFGKCFLYFTYVPHRGGWQWRITSGDKLLKEGSTSKVDAYKDMLTDVACQEMP
jgi:hypothetical protein